MVVNALYTWIFNVGGLQWSNVYFTPIKTHFFICLCLEGSFAIDSPTKNALVSTLQPFYHRTATRGVQFPNIVSSGIIISNIIFIEHQFEFSSFMTTLFSSTVHFEFVDNSVG